MEPDLLNVVETRLLRTRAPGTPSIEIGILEKRLAALDLRLPPMLLLHGATFGARLFDLPRAGYSLMAALASRGGRFMPSTSGGLEPRSAVLPWTDRRREIRHLPAWMRGSRTLQLPSMSS
jgi:hypothetical protein